MITRNIMVLRRSSNVPGLYLEQTEEGQRATYSLMIGERLQLDLGDPEQITVTVDPGDRLNG